MPIGSPLPRWLAPLLGLIALFLILQRYWRGGMLLGSIAN